MNKVSNPEQSSHAMRFSTTTIGDGSLATDVSKSAHTTMPDVLENSHAELFDDRTTLLGHDAQATLKNQAVPSSETRDGTAPSPASSNVIVVRYAPTEPNAVKVFGSDYRPVAAGLTLIVCVEGLPSWNEIVTLVHNSIDCSGVTLLPVDVTTTQLNPAINSATDRLVPIVTSTASPEPVAQLGGTRSNNLTPREIEVVQLYQSGVSTKNIANILGISIETVRTHRKKIFLKLNCTSIVQAVTKMIAMNTKTPNENKYY